MNGRHGTRCIASVAAAINFVMIGVVAPDGSVYPLYNPNCTHGVLAEYEGGRGTQQERATSPVRPSAKIEADAGQLNIVRRTAAPERNDVFW